MWGLLQQLESDSEACEMYVCVHSDVHVNNVSVCVCDVHVNVCMRTCE